MERQKQDLDTGDDSDASDSSNEAMTPHRPQKASHNGEHKANKSQRSMCVLVHQLLGSLLYVKVFLLLVLLRLSGALREDKDSEMNMR